MLADLPTSPPHKRKAKLFPVENHYSPWEFTKDFYRVTSLKQWTAYTRDAGQDAIIELMPFMWILSGR